MRKGHVIWLTGISGSGKTTLADLLLKHMNGLNLKAAMLDGDVVRDFFEGDLGYTRPERVHNVRRIAFAAKMLADNGTTTIVANIAPYYEVRDFIRRKTDRYIQVYLKATIGKVAERDVKGHYGKLKAGEMQNLIGADDAYDVPRNPDLTVDTDNLGVEESFAKILALLESRGVFNG